MKKLKTLILGLITALGLTGCGISDWVQDRVCEQQVQFYQVAKDPKTNYIDAAITDGKDVHLAFTWNAANKVVSKLEQKAVTFVTWISTAADEKARLAETPISLKAKDSEDAEECKIMQVEAFVEGDDAVFAPYGVAVGRKYTGDKDGSMALKVVVDLKKLYSAAEISSDVFDAHFRIKTSSGAGNTITWKYEKVSDNEFRTYGATETEITISGGKRAYIVGDKFGENDFNLEVKVHYENTQIPERELAPKEYVIDNSAIDLSAAGTYAVIVTYGELTASYDVTVAEAVEPETSTSTEDSNN